MSERKRRKSTATDARRLRGYVDDLLGISGAISAHSALKHKSRAPPLPLRPVAARERAQQGPPSATSRTRRPAPEPPQSLFSMAAAKSTRATASGGGDDDDRAAADARDSWRRTLLATAAELGADSDAQDRSGRLLRRVDALAATVAVQQAQVSQLSSEIVVNERVEAQLEREEREWEEKMQVREQRVAELEVELRALQEAKNASHEHGAGGSRQSENNHQHSSGRDDDDEDEVQEEEDGKDDDEEDNASARHNAEIREALALRSEEKRDIKAALASLLRKHQQRQFQRAPESDASATGPSERERALTLELHELQAEKDALQRQIIASEEEQEERDEHSAELPELKARVVATKQRCDEAHERLASAKHALARLKLKLKHMVDVQLLTAGDTNPSTLREEAVILHLLYAHEGEMGVNELKLETGAAMAAHGKPSASGAVIRALYSLVANGVVQIDRSYGNGLVTSLLV